MKWNIVKGVRLFLFIGLPLLLLMTASDVFPQFRVRNMANANVLFDSVVFKYGDFQTTLFESRHKTRYIFLPSFADISKLEVEIQNPRVDFIVGDDVISVYNNQNNICSFMADVEYDVRFYDSVDGKEVISQTVVCFMQSANLPTLYLSTQSGNFDKIDKDKKYSEEAVFSFVTEEGDILHSNISAEISARGNHTFDYEKKSYQFDLVQECDLLGMGLSDTWILLPNSLDLTNLRNKITYDMAVYVGMEGSPQSEFVDVYLNDVYHGTYLLTEKVEFGKNRLDYEDLENKNLALNGNNLNTYKTFSSGDGTQKGYLLPEAPADITGGYLVEHDYGMKFESEASGFITSGNECFVLKNPKHATASEVEYISRIFQEIEDAIKDKNGYNPETGKHYTEYIDLKSWADKYIIEEFCKNQGGGCTSSYFYKLSDSVDTKVYGGPVWDYDKAYGVAGGTCNSLNDLNFLTIHLDYTSWFYYLYQHEDFREMVNYEYQNFFAPYINDNIEKDLERYSELLQPSLKMNFERFEEMYGHLQVVTDTENYNNQVDYLRDFIILRKNNLDELWGNDAQICRVSFEDELDRYRCVAVKKGDKLEALPEFWGSNVETAVWKDNLTGEAISVGMVVTQDIIAVVGEK